MQPKPIAETSRLLVPSFRFFIFESKDARIYSTPDAPSRAFLLELPRCCSKLRIEGQRLHGVSVRRALDTFRRLWSSRHDQCSEGVARSGSFPNSRAE